MKKRLCAALLAGLLAISALPVSAASTDMKLNFSYPDGLSPGDTFAVEVECSDNPGFCSVQIALSFDQKVLDCTGIDLGPALDGMMTQTNHNAPVGAKVICASALPTEEDGVMATLHFKVLAAGDYDFEVCEYIIKDVESKAVPVTLTLSPTTPSGGASSGSSSSSGSGSSYGDNTSDSKEENTPTFTDIDGHWAKDYIQLASKRGLAAGIGNNQYGPELSLTRAQFVTMLWANAGKPQANDSTFTDLTQDWYRDAVNWAAANGYVAGYDDNTFRPETKITREQVAVILRSMWVKAGNTPGMEQMFAGIYDAAFDDSANISLWAKHAVYWAHYKGIWCGTDSLKYEAVLNPDTQEEESFFAPKAEATRAQFAVMLGRFLDL